jgi:hypothetical protein
MLWHKIKAQLHPRLQLQPRKVPQLHQILQLRRKLQLRLKLQNLNLSPRLGLGLRANPNEFLLVAATKPPVDMPMASAVSNDLKWLDLASH